MWLPWAVHRAPAADGAGSFSTELRNPTCCWTAATDRFWRKWSAPNFWSSWRSWKKNIEKWSPLEVVKGPNNWPHKQKKHDPDPDGNYGSREEVCFLFVFEFDACCWSFGWFHIGRNLGWSPWLVNWGFILGIATGSNRNGQVGRIGSMCFGWESHVLPVVIHDQKAVSIKTLQSSLLVLRSFIWDVEIACGHWLGGSANIPTEIWKLLLSRMMLLAITGG